MSNSNRASGLSPVKYLNGTPWNGAARTYHIPSTDTAVYRIGDPVTIGGTADAAGVPDCVLATAGSGNTVLGPIVSMGGTKYAGMHADPSALDTMTIPATKTHDYYVMVCDDPNVVYMVQENSTASQATAATVGLNANLIAGTTSAFLSDWVVAAGAGAASSVYQVKLLGLQQTSDNAFGAYAKWLVKINNHPFANGVTGL